MVQSLLRHGDGFHGKPWRVESVEVAIGRLLEGDSGGWQKMDCRRAMICQQIVKIFFPFCGLPVNFLGVSFSGVFFFFGTSSLYTLGINSSLRHCRYLLHISHPFVNSCVTTLCGTEVLILVQNSSILYGLCFLSLKKSFLIPKLLGYSPTFSSILALQFYPSFLGLSFIWILPLFQV